MTDIAERLRAHGQPKGWHTPGHPMNGWLSVYEAQAIGREAADEIERLRAENAAFRHAIRTGDGPSCENVCLVECVGVCGITFEENPC